MQTLTPEEFKQRYGVVATSQFNNTQQQKEAGLFDSIKNTINTAAQNNVDIYNQGTSGKNSFLDNMNTGTQLAANTFGGVAGVAGDVLSHTPLIGGAVKAVGNVVKGGFDKITNALGNTKFFQEAAAGLKPGNALEKGLSIAASGGQIAGDILGADQGAGILDKATSIPSKIGSGAVRTAEKIPKMGEVGQNTFGAASDIRGKLPSAVQDVLPTAQSLIDHNLARALDLTPGDLKNISASTGNEVGRFMADNNLIGTNKATTLGLIRNFFTNNYKAVRSEISKVDTLYKPSSIPRFTDTLKALSAETQGRLGLEATNKEINGLLSKTEVTLNDVQHVKELLDEYYNLYKVTGDVQAGVAKQGLANVRQQMKSFIESEVKKNTGSDIQQLNNNVATAKSLGDAIEARTPRGLTRANITWRDFAVGAGLTYFATPLVGLAAVLAKKVLTSPSFRLRFARYIDSLGDAERRRLSESLKNGEVPKSVLSETGPLQ